MSNTETQYEKYQKFNPLVSWLHTLRYNNTLSVFKEFSASSGDSPIKIIEIGCAHAKLFSVLNDQFNIKYTGIEPKQEFVEIAKDRYHHFKNFKIIQGAAEKHLNTQADVDIVVALETLEHISEHIVVRVVEEVTRIQPKLFILSVPVEIGPSIWFKNVGSLITGYIRHKEYTWPETFWAGLGQLDKLPPHGTGHKGFDWRWLAQTVRHNMKIKEIRKFPLSFLPAGLSMSVFFVAEPRHRD